MSLSFQLSHVDLFFSLQVNRTELNYHPWFFITQAQKLAKECFASVFADPMRPVKEMLPVKADPVFERAQAQQRAEAVMTGPSAPAEAADAVSLLWLEYAKRLPNRTESYIDAPVCDLPESFFACRCSDHAFSLRLLQKYTMICWRMLASIPPSLGNDSSRSVSSLHAQ